MLMLLVLLSLLQVAKSNQPQQWLVQDMQGNVAQVAAADLGDGSHRVHASSRLVPACM
jgi:hypothetical protein